MQYLLLTLLIFVFIKTASYSLWEKNENNNTTGAIFVFILATAMLAVTLFSI